MSQVPTTPFRTITRALLQCGIYTALQLRSCGSHTDTSLIAHIFYCEFRDHTYLPAILQCNMECPR